jgi:hypothetical protein
LQGGTRAARQRSLGRPCLPEASAVAADPNMPQEWSVDTQWIILCGLLVFPALLAAALIWIARQDRRVRAWPRTSGRVVSAQAVARTVRRKRHRTEGPSGYTDFVTDETIETRNFAEVTYQFAVAGKTYRGSRVRLGVDGGNVAIAETLTRYPAGAIVAVFYDPADPTQCILERDERKNLRAGWLAVALLTALIVGGVLGIDRLADVVRGMIGNPARTPLVMGLGLFGTVAALFAVLIGRKRREMRGWSRTPGRIVESTVATTTQQHSRQSGAVTRQTMYVPRIVYRYEAGGIALQGDDIGGTWSGSTPAVARKYTARYPLDAAVEVFFNPDNTTESTLAPPGRTVELVLWAFAAALLAAAVLAAHAAPGVISP